MVSHAQLHEFGFTAKAIERRLENGRLHRLRWRGVFAVGRPQLSTHGLWMAAVLRSGRGAVLSHQTAAELWRIRVKRSDPIHISIPRAVGRRLAGIRVHRRSLGQGERALKEGIPVTAPIRTLVDLAAALHPYQLEAVVNEADRLDLVDPESLRSALPAFAGQRGVARLRLTLDRSVYAFTDSELERRFLPIARAAGLPKPQTGVWLNGFKVDFYWPRLGLVIETDGLRYHRTPAQQARDRQRDQTHTAAGLTTLRFTHGQIRYERERVKATLTRVVRRLEARLHAE